MKKFALVFVNCVISLTLLAQSKAYVLKRDTINIRGYVFNSEGKPAIGEIVTSQQKELVHNFYQISSKTDSNGYFELKGAAFNDTLYVTNGIEYLTYQNHGSRYSVIYLPAPNVSELINPGSLIISARRLLPKKIPEFKIISDDGTFGCAWEYSPEYPGGIDQLVKYINLNLRYPYTAIANYIEGDVKIRFTVEKDGSLTNLKVLQGIGYGCDDAVIAILKNSKIWKPGQINGHALTIDYTVTIPFRLTDK